MATRIMKAFSGISLRILLTVLLTVILVIGLSSLIELNLLKQQETKNLQGRAEIAADRMANTLAYPLWNLNRLAAGQVLLDEIGSGDAFRIQVFDEHGVLYVGKAKDADGALRDLDVSSAGDTALAQVAFHSYSRTVKFKNTVIGTITLDVTDEHLRAEVGKLGRGIAAKLLLLVTFLSLVLFVALRLLVVNPISALEAWVETIPSAIMLSLPRFDSSAEVNSLAEAFGNMSTKLRKNNEMLQHERERLEELNRRMQGEIEERKRAEEALREGEETQHALLNAPTELAMLTDTEGTILALNDAAVHRLGKHGSELIGTNSLTMFPDGLAKQRKTYADQAMATGKPIRFEDTRAGRYFDNNIYPVFSANGSVTRLAIFARDITESKQAEIALLESEERYRILVENAPEAIVVLDLDHGTFTDMNDNAARLFKLSRNELRRIGPIDMSPPTQPDGRPSLESAMEKLNKAALGETPRFEWVHRNALGEDIPCEISLVRLPSTTQTLVRGSIIDITERKRADEALKKSHEQLRALTARLQTIREEERTTIAREVHDDLGQSLTGLKMDLAWTRKHLPDEQMTITKKIDSMVELVNTSIQTVRHIATELRPGVLDSLGLLAAIEWQAQEFRRRTSITCTVRSSLENVTFDKLQSTVLFRIFQETLTNIIRHANASRVDVSLNREQNMLVLSIKDNGRGITPDEISNPKSLGLLGIRERARMVNGDVVFEGIPGKGTTCTIRVSFAEPVTLHEHMPQ